jgi:hypothetical protein
LEESDGLQEEEEEEVTFSRQFWMTVRQALLSIVDAMEKELGLTPTTAEIRKLFKNSGD